MATYVGAFLLVVLTFVQVVAMFSPTTHNSEIINNAFLLILGYFFGQSVGRPPVGRLAERKVLEFSRRGFASASRSHVRGDAMSVGSRIDIVTKVLK